MRISDHIVPSVLLAAGLGMVSAFAFDGSRSPNDVAPAVSIDVVPRTSLADPAVSAPALAAPVVVSPALTPLSSPELKRGASAVEAFRIGTQALRAGDVKTGLRALEYAADNGHAIARWKLGRMYADGDQVKQDHYRAFQYFQEIADEHAEDNPGTPRARFVANAFVVLGTYYLAGIPDSSVVVDPERARTMFSYAASYFGDADAQFNLGRMFLYGTGGARDVRQAARWLTLAANKGQPQAQALLGTLLVKGDVLPRQVARGLMWLTLARDSAPQDKSIADLHAGAAQQATEDQRAAASGYIEGWLKGRRD